MQEPANRVAEWPRPSPEFPRRYLPGSFDFDDPAALERVFGELAGRRIGDAPGLEAWLLDISETFAALSEERGRRYIAMTCATDDPEREADYLGFVERVLPRWKTAGFELDRKWLAHPAADSLPRPRYDMRRRHARNEIELYREENLPLETELSRLAQRYQKLCGAMSVEFRGRTHPVARMSVFLQDPDRPTRREAWRETSRRRLRDREAIDALFDRMVETRGRVARQAGFDSYRDYMFRRLGRFDYRPADCERFHRAVEKLAVPAARTRLEDRARALGLDRLQPWDLACDPHGRPPLRPFDSIPRLVAGCGRIFERVDPALGRHFGLLGDRGLLDLDSRVGKAPGGYQNTLDESRVPFIFMNAAGVQRDVTTLLHEAGHAFHGLETRAEPLLAYRHAPIEFCEVASMSMELIGGAFFDEFYSEADSARARLAQMEEILALLPWVAWVDAFQHWIYTRPSPPSAEERAGEWMRLAGRFGPGPILDLAGCEEDARFGWHRQLHFFQVPFYYIEYGIAQLGALQLWRRYREDPGEAVAAYRGALALGGSRPLPELFEAAGIRFGFDGDILRPCLDDVLAEARRMEEAAGPGASGPQRR